MEMKFYFKIKKNNNNFISNDNEQFIRRLGVQETIKDLSYFIYIRKTLTKNTELIMEGFLNDCNKLFNDYRKKLKNITKWVFGQYCNNFL